MKTIKTWLTKSVHGKSAPVDEVNLVLYDLATNDIGIKGCDMFTITYGFLGGVSCYFLTIFFIHITIGNTFFKKFSSLVLTLFILSVQHKQQ